METREQKLARAKQKLSSFQSQRNPANATPAASMQPPPAVGDARSTPRQGPNRRVCGPQEIQPGTGSLEGDFFTPASAPLPVFSASPAASGGNAGTSAFAAPAPVGAFDAPLAPVPSSLFGVAAPSDPGFVASSPFDSLGQEEHAEAPQPVLDAADLFFNPGRSTGPSDEEMDQLVGQVRQSFETPSRPGGFRPLDPGFTTPLSNYMNPSLGHPYSGPSDLHEVERSGTQSFVPVDLDGIPEQSYHADYYQAAEPSTVASGYYYEPQPEAVFEQEYYYPEASHEFASAFEGTPVEQQPYFPPSDPNPNPDGVSTPVSDLAFRKQILASLTRISATLGIRDRMPDFNELAQRIRGLGEAQISAEIADFAGRVAESLEAAAQDLVADQDARVDTLESEKEEAARALEESRAEFEALQMQAASASDMAARCADLERILEEERNGMAALSAAHQAELDSLRGLLEQAENEQSASVSDMAARCADLEKLLEEERSGMAALSAAHQAELDSLRERLEHAESGQAASTSDMAARCADLEKALEEERTGMAALSAAHQAELDSLRGLLEQAENEKAASTSDMAARCADLERLLAEERNEMAAFSAGHQAELDSMRGRLEQAENEAMEARAAVEARVQELQEVRQRLLAADARLSETSSDVLDTAAEMDQLRAELEATKEALNSATETLDTLRDQHGAAQTEGEALRAEMASLRSERNALQEQLDSLAGEFSSTKEQLEAQYAETESARQQASNALASAEDKSNELERILTSVSDLENAISELRDVNAKLEEELMVTKERAVAAERSQGQDTYSEELETLRAEYQQIREALEAARDDADMARSQLSDFQAAYASLMESQASKDQELDVLRSEAARSQDAADDVESAQKRILELESELASLNAAGSSTSSQSDLLARIGELESQLHSASEAAESLRSRVMQLESELQERAPKTVAVNSLSPAVSELGSAKASELTETQTAGSSAVLESSQPSAVKPVALAELRTVVEARFQQAKSSGSGGKTWSEKVKVVQAAILEAQEAARKQEDQIRQLGIISSSVAGFRSLPSSPEKGRKGSELVRQQARRLGELLAENASLKRSRSLLEQRKDEEIRALQDKLAERAVEPAGLTSPSQATTIVERDVQDPYLLAQLAEKDRLIVQYQNDMEEAQMISKNLASDLESRIAELNGRLEQLSSELGQRVRENAALATALSAAPTSGLEASEIEPLRTQIAQLMAEKQALSEDLEEARSAKDHLESNSEARIEALGQQLQEASDRLDVLLKEKAELVVQLDSQRLSTSPRSADESIFEALRLQVETLTGEKDVLEMELQKAISAKEVALAAQADFEARLADSERMRAELFQTLSDFGTRLETAEAERDRANIDRERVATAASAEIDAVREELQELKDVAARLAESDRMRTELAQILADVEGRLQAAEAEKERATADREHAMEAVSAEVSRLRDELREFNDCQVRLSESENSRNELGKSLQALEARLQVAEAERDQATEARERAVEVASAEASRLRDELQELKDCERRLSESESMRDELGKSLETLRDRLEALEAERDEANLERERTAASAAAELETLRNELRELVYLRNKLQAELSEVSAQLADSEEARNTLARVADDLRHEVETAGDRSAHELEQAVSAAKSDAEALRAELERALKVAEEAVRKAENDISERAATFDAEKRQLVENAIAIESKLADLSLEKDTLTDLLETERANTTELARALQKAHEGLEVQSARLQELQELLDKARQQRIQAEQDYEQLAASFRNVEHELQLAEIRSPALSGTTLNESTWSDLGGLVRENVSRGWRALDELQTVFDTFGIDRSKLSRDITAAGESLESSLQQSVDEAQMEIRRLRDQLLRATSLAESAGQRILDLERELESSQQSSTLEAALADLRFEKEAAELHYATIMSQNNSLREEIERLQLHLKNASQNTALADEQRREVAFFRQNLEEANRRILELREERDELKRRIQEVQAGRKMDADQIQALLDDLRDLTERLGESRIERQGERQKFENAKADLEQRIRDQGMEIDRLERQIAESRQKLLEESEEHDRELLRVVGEARALEDQVRAASQAEHEVILLREEVASLRGLLETEKGDAVALEESVAHLSTENLQLKASQLALEQAKAALSEELFELNRSHKELVGLYEENRLQSDQLAGFNAQLSSELATAKDAQARAAEELVQLRQLVSKLQASQASQLQLRDAYSSGQRAMELECDRLRADVARLQEELDRAVRDRESVRRDRDSVLMKLKNEMAEIDVVLKEREDTIRTFVELRRKFADAANTPKGQRVKYGA